MGSRFAAIQGTDRLRLFALAGHVLAALPAIGMFGYGLVTPVSPSTAFVLPLAIWLVGAALHALASALSAIADRSTRSKRIEGLIAAVVLAGAAGIVVVLYSPIAGGDADLLFALTLAAMLALPVATLVVLWNVATGSGGGVESEAARG